MTSIVQAVARQKTVPEKPWERSWISLVVFVELEKWWEFYTLRGEEIAERLPEIIQRTPKIQRNGLHLAIILKYKLFWMNNKTIIGFIFRVIWQIICISEGVIRVIRSNNCKIAQFYSITEIIPDY